MRRPYINVDRRTCIVMRKKKAIHLGFVQFCIFEALHKREAKRLTGDRLADIVYHGANNPSTRQTIHTCICTMNKKLAYLGLKIRGESRKSASFYELLVVS